MFGLAMGGDHHTISISNRTIPDFTFAPTVADARFSIENDGDLAEYFGSGGGLSDYGDWISPKDSFSNYEVRATESVGAVSSGTVGSWLSLGTTRTWTRTHSGAGTSSVQLLIEIRHAITLVVRASATITLTANVT